MSTSTYRETLFAHVRAQGVRGIGEGAPIPRYGEDARRSQLRLDRLRPALSGISPWRIEETRRWVARDVKGEYAARAAVDIALHDWAGHRLRVPLYRLLGLDRDRTPVTSFSIGIGSAAETRRKVRAARDFPVLKVKMGRGVDETTLESVRAETDVPVRVDVNEGWKSVRIASTKVQWLARRGVEFVEQPLPAGRLADVRRLHRSSVLPIFADEDAPNVAALPGLVGAYDGVNVKLDKCGGIGEALTMIRAARALGFRTMLGCMVSSAVSVTAAAHLSPLVDYADLDGNLLIADDPRRGVAVRKGRLILPRGPGLGIVPR